MTPANEYTMSELVWLVTHGTQTTRERASAELDRRFPNAAAQPEAVGWQPIRTAPQDRFVLVFGIGESSPPVVAKWTDGAWELRFRNGMGFRDYGVKSHWMPLPEVPK